MLGTEFGVKNVPKALCPYGSMEGAMEGVIVLLTLEYAIHRLISLSSLLEVDEGNLTVGHAQNHHGR